MRSLPVADPGVPDARSPFRYLWWIARGQAGPLLIGIGYAILWWLGQAMVPLTLGKAFYRFPNAWLLGGPTVAMEALKLGMVDQVLISNVPTVLFERGQPFSPTGLVDAVTPWLQSRGERQNAGVPWRNAGVPWRIDQRIPLGDGTIVSCWRRLDSVSGPQP